MSNQLTRSQLDLIRWRDLRSGRGSALDVQQDLRTLLLVDDKRADEAYRNLENSVVCQGNLFQCAPAVVSVIAAVLSEGAVAAASLASVLDFLGRILAGEPNPTEKALGYARLRSDCHEEAMRAYWTLAALHEGADPLGAWKVAGAVLRVLDSDRPTPFRITHAGS